MSQGPKDGARHFFIHTKLRIPTSNNIGDMLRKRSSEKLGHNDLKMLGDTLLSKYASILKIWNNYLKEYRRYAPDRNWDGRRHGQCDYYMYMPPKSPLEA